MRLTLLLALLTLSACSIRKSAFNTIGSALSGASDELARDEDPELVRGAIPFSLKVMETILKEDPHNAQMLSGLCKGFSSYAYGFVLQDADELDDKDKIAAKAARDRAGRLFLRSRNYGLRYFELKHPTFAADLKANPKKAAAQIAKADVPMLFWTALGWAGALSSSKDFLMLPQIPQFEALMERALELDETYDQGAIHAFYVTYEMAKLTAKADKAQLAKKHFDRAMELSGGRQAGPLLSYAESVLLPSKDRAGFESTLRQALKIDVNAAPESRVLNLILQKRARMLLSRIDKLFPPAK